MPPWCMGPRKEDLWSHWRFWLNMAPLWIDLMEEEIHRFTVQPTINTLTLWCSLLKRGALLYVINKERMSAFTYAVIVGHLGTDRNLHRYGGFMHFCIQHWPPALRCVTTSYSNVYNIPINNASSVLFCKVTTKLSNLYWIFQCQLIFHCRLALECPINIWQFRSDLT